MRYVGKIKHCFVVLITIKILKTKIKTIVKCLKAKFKMLWSLSYKYKQIHEYIHKGHVYNPELLL